MNKFACKKCGSVNIHIKENETQIGLYCSDCGAWIKWLGKDDKIIAELQILRNNAVDEELEQRVDLSQISNEELLNEIAKRMK